MELSKADANRGVEWLADGVSRTVRIKSVSVAAEFELSILEFKAGAALEIDVRPQDEWLGYVTEGTGSIMQGSRQSPIVQDMVVRSQAVAVDLVGGSRGLRVVEVRQLAGADIDQGDTNGSALSRQALSIFSAEQSVETDFHEPSRGFYDVKATILADESEGGFHHLLMGKSRFPARDSRHALHRHPNADEWMVVLGGAGAHLTQGSDISVQAGDVGLIPAGEWHGLANTGAEELRLLFGFFGAASLASAGYELPQS